MEKSDVETLDAKQVGVVECKKRRREREKESEIYWLGDTMGYNVVHIHTHTA